MEVRPAVPEPGAGEVRLGSGGDGEDAEEGSVAPDPGVGRARPSEAIIPEATTDYEYL